MQNVQAPPGLPSVEIELEVPFVDVDSQRIVWHGNYFKYFELARVQLFAKCDLFSLIEEGAVDFVVSESYCKHYHPLRFRDRCTVRVSFVDIDHRLNMRFLITKQDGTKIAKGHTHVVSLNSDGRLQLVTPSVVTERILKAGRETPPPPPSRRAFVATSLALLGLLLDPELAEASALPASLLKLLEQHKQAPGLFARFVEEKHISFLKAPLKNEGYLAYQRPDRFARVVEQPSPSKIVAQGNTLAFREGNGPKTELSLHNRPELKALVEGIVFLLAGDVQQIEKLYSIEVKTCAATCQVALVPKDPKMGSLVKKFVVNTDGGGLASFEVHEQSGDYSVTRLLDLDLRRTFSEAEKKSLFSI